jgi:hypothetical protein
MSTTDVPQDHMLLMATIASTGETITMRAPMGTLPVVLETLERFIKAAGYHPEGVLDFINEDTDKSTTGRTST